MTLRREITDFLMTVPGMDSADGRKALIGYLGFAHLNSLLDFQGNAFDFTSRLVALLESRDRAELRAFLVALESAPHVGAEGRVKLAGFAAQMDAEGDVTWSQSPDAAIRAEKERDKYFNILSDFLIPLTNYLAYTYTVFDQLRRDTGIEHLEYDPEGLKRLYAGLPKKDKRRITWMGTIEHLQDENQKIIVLIDANAGNIVLPEFRKACLEFKQHANEWAIFWKAVQEHGFDTPREICEGLASTPFPSSFSDALKAEYAEVEKRASDGE